MKAKLLVLFSIIVLPTCYAIWKNSTFVEMDFTSVYEKVDNIYFMPVLDVYADNLVPLMHYDNDTSSLREVYEASDVVAIVQPISRKQQSSVVNTEVQIKKNLKSDYNVGDTISIFEQFYIHYEVSGGKEYADFVSTGGYIPMNLEKQYLVFLKKSKSYASDQYGFLSLLYGKYPYVSKTFTTLEIPIDKNGGLDYVVEDLYKQDVVLFDISEEKSDDLGSYKEETKDYLIKYNAYKKDYINKLQAFIDCEYDVETLK